MGGRTRGTKRVTDRRDTDVETRTHRQGTEQTLREKKSKKIRSERDTVGQESKRYTPLNHTTLDPRNGVPVTGVPVPS